MAKNTVNHSCGHTTEVQLYGKSSERERRLAYLETTLCPDCYAAQQATAQGGEWIEMHYGEYKNNHPTCKTRNYNAETKTIFVLVNRDEPTEEPQPHSNEAADHSRDSQVNEAANIVRTAVAQNPEALEALEKALSDILPRLGKYSEQRTLSGALTAMWYTEFAPQHGGARSLYISAFAAIQTQAKKLGY